MEDVPRSMSHQKSLDNGIALEPNSEALSVISEDDPFAQHPNGDDNALGHCDKSILPSIPSQNGSVANMGCVKPTDDRCDVSIIAGTSLLDGEKTSNKTTSVTNNDLVKSRRVSISEIKVMGTITEESFGEQSGHHTVVSGRNSLREREVPPSSSLSNCSAAKIDEYMNALDVIVRSKEDEELKNSLEVSGDSKTNDAAIGDAMTSYAATVGVVTGVVSTDDPSVNDEESELKELGEKRDGMKELRISHDQKVCVLCC